VFFCLKSYVQYIESFYITFSHCKAKFDADKLFFLVCHFSGTLKFANGTTCSSTVLQPYCKQEMTHQIVSCLHILVEVCGWQQ
jgi:hypothetical protein